jgi:hypothetical protein
MSLSSVRVRNAMKRKFVAEGMDPNASERSARAETFEAVADEWLEPHEKVAGAGNDLILGTRRGASSTLIFGLGGPWRASPLTSRWRCSHRSARKE